MRKALRTLNSSVDPWVFYAAVALTGLFVLWGAVATKNLAHLTSIALDFTIANFGWAYVLSAFGFVLFILCLAFSRFGRIRLGRDDEKPEFRTSSWIAMMFSAGMGIGLMFYGIAEPMSHFTNPPFDLAEPGSPQAAQLAMQYTVFHWALQPWAVYALFGLAVAYFTFRKGQGNLVSESFRPLIGHRVEGPVGRTIEILAILATLFGSATSLGLGALQINSGLTYLWSIPNTIGLAIVVIAVVTVLFIISAVSGIHRGIEWLSNTNMVLALVLVAFLFITGPTVYILDSFVRAIGSYFQHYLLMSFRTGAYGGSDWLGSWTIFYWAWWISWAPFVGTFVARISRGRTIREFVIGVLAAPSVICLAWFTILGGTALHLELSGAAGIAAAVQQSQAAALFSTLNALPWSFITSFVAVILIALFFISGADAASVVMGMLSSRGSLKPNKIIVIIWGVMTGAAAAILLMAGGLRGLQTGAILSAGPFVVVLIGMCFSVLKALRSETRPTPDLRAAGRDGRTTDAPGAGRKHGHGTGEGAPASPRVTAWSEAQHTVPRRWIALARHPPSAWNKTGGWKLDYSVKPGGASMEHKHGRHPFQGVTDFFSEMSRMSGVMHGRSLEVEPRTAASAWAPLTDILARGEDLVIRCELPGVEMKDIVISFSNSVLSISGSRETEAADSYYVRERFFGTFRRAISLPEGVGDDDIHASFNGGLLVITIEGGATAAEPKQIRIAGDGD